MIRFNDTYIIVNIRAEIYPNTKKSQIGIKERALEHKSEMMGGNAKTIMKKRLRFGTEMLNKAAEALPQRKSVVSW